MTWARQVVHIAGKDIRQWKLLYAAFAVVVLAATIHAMGYMDDVAIFSVSQAFVILAAMLLIAVVIQGDSPTRADAFWASRPLQPTAVASAKVAQVLLVMLIPLIGQSIALVARGVAAARLPHYLPSSAGLFVLWLAAALVAAALTREVQGAIVAFIATAIVFGLAVVTMNGGPNVGHTLSIVLTSALTLLALGLMYFLYGRRMRPRAIVAIGMVAMLAPLVSLLPGRTTPISDNGPLRTNLQVALADSLGFDRSEIPLRIHVDGINKTQRASIDEALVTFNLVNGRTIEAGRYSIPVAFGDSVPTPTPLTWVQAHGGGESRPVLQINVHLAPDERAEAAKGVKSINISGVVRVMEPTVINTFPLRAGVQQQIGDSRLLIERADVLDSDARLTVHLTGPIDNEAAIWTDSYMANAAQFALVNESRGEAVPISSNNMSSENAMLVMPGTTLSAQTFTLSLRNAPMQRSRLASANGTTVTSAVMTSRTPVPMNIDGPWLKGAKVMLLSWHQKERYRISGTLVVKQ